VFFAERLYACILDLATYSKRAKDPGRDGKCYVITRVSGRSLREILLPYTVQSSSMQFPVILNGEF
jgi:hypothetical protein